MLNLNQDRRWELYTSMNQVIPFEPQSVSVVILLEPLKYIFKTAYIIRMAVLLWPLAKFYYDPKEVI